MTVCIHAMSVTQAKNTLLNTHTKSMSSPAVRLIGIAVAAFAYEQYRPPHMPSLKDILSGKPNPPQSTSKASETVQASETIAPNLPTPDTPETDGSVRRQPQLSDAFTARRRLLERVTTQFEDWIVDNMGTPCDSADGDELAANIALDSMPSVTGVAIEQLRTVVIQPEAEINPDLYTELDGIFNDFMEGIHKNRVGTVSHGYHVQFSCRDIMDADLKKWPWNGPLSLRDLVGRTIQLYTIHA